MTSYTLQTTQPVPHGNIPVLVTLGGPRKPFEATMIPVIEIPDPAGDRKLREDVAYLGLFNAWRLQQLEAGIIFEPEPERVTAALENVTRHLLRELNARLAVRPIEPFDNWHAASCPARSGGLCECSR